MKQKYMGNKKRQVVVLLLFTIFISCSENEKIVDEALIGPKPELPSIAILGTFHFGATSDFSSMDLDNFQSPKRQLQIKNLLDHLKKYKPTKIMVEYPMDHAEALNQTYLEYLEGTHELTINEIEQLGFRLAKALGHIHMYSIDYTLSLPLDQLAAFAQNHKAEEFDAFLNSIKENDKKDSELLRERTLIEYYAYKNSEEEDLKNKNQYVVGTGQFVSDSTYIGVEFVARWWERNFYIMSNIDRHITKDDRILVIIGGAHRAVLKDFYKDRHDIEYIEIQDYLKS